MYGEGAPARLGKKLLINDVRGVCFLLHPGVALVFAYLRRLCVVPSRIRIAPPSRMLLFSLAVSVTEQWIAALWVDLTTEKVA